MVTPAPLLPPPPPPRLPLFTSPSSPIVTAMSTITSPFPFTRSLLSLPVPHTKPHSDAPPFLLRLYHPPSFISSPSVTASDDGADGEDEVPEEEEEDNPYHIRSSATHSDPFPDDDDGDDYPDCQFHQGPHSDPKASILEVDAVGEILEIARNLGEDTAALSDLMRPFEGKVREGDCIVLLKRMGEERLVVPSLQLWEWMGSQRPPLVSPPASSALFLGLGRAGMGKELLVSFANLPRERRFRDVRIYNAAIVGFASCRRYDDAWKVYEAMETDNVMPDYFTCATLITIIRKAGGSAKEAWEFFEKMNRKGLEWRLEVIVALIKSFCAEGMKKEALIILSEMEKKGIPSDVIIYNTLMDAYVKSDRIEEAEGLFKEMKGKGLTPTVATYNVLMDAYSRRMQPEIIENLLNEMGSLGLKPDAKSYTYLISAYGKQRKMCDLAANAFLRMRKTGIKPTSHSFAALIHAYSVGGLHEKALSAFEDMKRQNISPSIETYTALLVAFNRAGDTDMLMKIWKLMGIDKIEGTRVTFNILLDGLAKKGMYVQARDVIQEFERLGIPPTVMTYNMLMNAYARGGQNNKLPQLLKEMGALTLKPDSITHLTMIHAYIRARDFKRAFYYHKQMVKSGQMPDARSYQKLQAILEKAAAKNKKDKSAILKIINSKPSLLKPKKGKKDEFWKGKKKRSTTTHAGHLRE